MSNVAAINTAIRGGAYQALAPYEIRAATAAGHPFVPASEANAATEAAVDARLLEAGFSRLGPAPIHGYGSAELLAQARIVVSGSGPAATIGVEIFNDPHVARLLEGGAS